MTSGLKPPAPPETPRRRYYSGAPRRRKMESAREPLHDVIAEECAKRGLRERRILYDWPLIVGKQLASVCTPARIVYTRVSEARAEGTLHLALIRPGAALELQTAQPRILEALASYLGHRAVRRVAVKQLYGIAPKRPAPRRYVPEDPARRRRLEGTAEGGTGAEIMDDRLRAALARLADAMCGLSEDQKNRR